MASVAFVTTELDEARPSPAKLPQAPGLQGVRSTESPTGFTPPAVRVALQGLAGRQTALDAQLPALREPRNIRCG